MVYTTYDLPSFTHTHTIQMVHETLFRMHYTYAYLGCHQYLMCLSQALHICIALLERRQAPPAGRQADALRQSMERAAAASAELDSKLEADAVEGICQHSNRLAALLDTSPQLDQLVSERAIETLQSNLLLNSQQTVRLLCKCIVELVSGCILHSLRSALSRISCWTQ